MQISISAGQGGDEGSERSIQSQDKEGTTPGPGGNEASTRTRPIRIKTSIGKRQIPGLGHYNNKVKGLRKEKDKARTRNFTSDRKTMTEIRTYEQERNKNKKNIEHEQGHNRDSETTGLITKTRRGTDHELGHTMDFGHGYEVHEMLYNSGKSRDIDEQFST